MELRSWESVNTPEHERLSVELLSQSFSGPTDSISSSASAGSELRRPLLSKSEPGLDHNLAALHASSQEQARPSNILFAKVFISNYASIVSRVKVLVSLVHEILRTRRRYSNILFANPFLLLFAGSHYILIEKELELFAAKFDWLSTEFQVTAERVYKAVHKLDSFVIALQFIMKGVLRPIFRELRKPAAIQRSGNKQCSLAELETGLMKYALQRNLFVDASVNRLIDAINRCQSIHDEYYPSGKLALHYYSLFVYILGPLRQSQVLDRAGITDSEARTMFSNAQSSLQEVYKQAVVHPTEVLTICRHVQIMLHEELYAVVKTQISQALLYHIEKLSSSLLRHYKSTDGACHFVDVKQDCFNIYHQPRLYTAANNHIHYYI